MCLARVATEHLLEADGESLVRRGEQRNATAQAEPLSVLIVSENVSPQVNGIARRVTHYIDGLRKLGCAVSVLEPENREKTWGHTNPWNCARRSCVLIARVPAMLADSARSAFPRQARWPELTRVRCVSQSRRA